MPGFSTAKILSSISGRGVGMDVVKTNIEKIGGTVDLSSKPGLGTTVKIKIPLTLAIIPGLVVASAGERFVIPQANLLELIRLEGDVANAQIEHIHGTMVYRRRGNLLPLARLAGVLGLEARAPNKSEVTNIVVVQAEDRQFGVIVDRIDDTQEIVVKPLASLLKHLRCYAGATIMGDGKVSLILDVHGVAQLSGVVNDSRDLANDDPPSSSAQSINDRQTFLLFRAGDFGRLAVPLSLVARLEEIPSSRIEHAAGGMVVQYRGQILPLVPLAVQLGCSSPRLELQDPVLVIVFADKERRIGIVVDHIIDIIEDTVTVKKASARNGLLGSAVVGGKVTDFLDLHAVTEAFDQDWFQQSDTEVKETTVLLAEASSFSRGLVCSYLEIAGHCVIEASTAQEAIDKLSKDAVDIVLTALDLPDRGAFELLTSIRAQSITSHIPVVALTGHGEETAISPNESGSFSDCLYKFDRIAMLRSLAKLAKALNPVDASVPHGQQLAGKER
ncbi:MAG: chemotaxis protein CheW [Acidobacteriota bacterium]|nr:chemotaxis protein CheW [Acidobacteriota bacterium]